jgi:hypothetical protein
MQAGITMKQLLLLSFCMAVSVTTHAQHFSADNMLDMLSLPIPKLEKQLLKKKYRSTGIEFYGDTAVKTYQYRTAYKKKYGRKIAADSVERNVLRSALKQTFTLTYQTTSATEYHTIIEGLKKKGFYCEYEKDSTVDPDSYLYQHEDYTADASTKKVITTTWYSVTFFKKILPVNKDLNFAENLLEFTSHEYLVYYFGEKNVKKDIYYFAGNDIVKCSVLLINTKRQVIFIWKDGLNRRKIDNLLFGGQHKLKSQETNEKFVAENSWSFKSGIRAGMPLYELRTLNDKNIVFCGGDAPNPGLIFPESTGKIDFENEDVILGCMNCTDDKFLHSKEIYADIAIEDGRILFVLTIVLYPFVTGIFD